MPYKDPIKQKEYLAKHYKDKKNTYHTNKNKNRGKYKIRNRQFSNRYKMLVGCKFCGYKKIPEALDFHHLSDKDNGISHMIAHSYSLSTIKDEMRKCIILCANCHREEHAKRGHPLR